MITRNKFLWTYLVPVLSKDKITFEEERKRLIFMLFILAAEIVLLIFGIYFLIGGFVVDALINFFMALLFFILVVIVRQKKDGTGIYRLIPISLGCLFIYFCTYDESHGYRILWVYSYPFVAIFLMGKLEGSLYTLLVFVVWVAVLVYPAPFTGAVLYEFEFKLRFTMSFVAIFIITFLLEGIREMYQEKMEDDQNKLNTEKKLLFRVEERLRNAKKQTEIVNNELEAKNTQLSNLIENMQDVLYRTNLQGELIWMSPSCEQIFGYKVAEVIGKQASDFYVNPEERNELIELLKHSSGSVKDFEAQLRRKDGSLIWISSNVHYFRDENGEIVGVEGIIRDTTDRRMMEERLREISFQDGLTGLSNRRHFDQYLDNEWNRALREAYPLSLIMIDIDYFKQFNDKYGHQSGDICLQKICNTIKKAVRRPGDFSARYGGEEMAVILPNTNAKNAQKMAETIRLEVQELEIPHEKSRINDHVTISAGVGTITPKRDMTPDLLVKKADEALYGAKAKGRNNVVVSR